MAENKVNNCVMFAVTSNIIFAVANVIIGIEKHSPNLIDRYVIYYLEDDPIIDKDKIAIQNISSKIEFRIYNQYKNIIETNELKLFTERYSKLVFAKFMIFELVKEFKNVLWLDADVLIQKDISPIFDFKPIAWRKANKKVISDSKKCVLEDCPNEGVIFVSDEIIKYNISFSECMQILLNESFMFTGAGADGITFMLALKKHNIDLKLLPVTYNCAIWLKEAEDSVIVHSIRKEKFWNDCLRNVLFREWRENNKKWIELGGSEYDGKIKDEQLGSSVGVVLNSLKRTIFWSNLLMNYVPAHGIIKSTQVHKNYIPLHIPFISNKVHYEFLKDGDVTKNNKIKVAFHIEESKYMIPDLISKLTKLSEDKKYKVVNDKTFSLEITVLESECLTAMDELIELTYNLIFETIIKNCF